MNVNAPVLRGSRIRIDLDFFDEFQQPSANLWIFDFPQLRSDE